MSEVTNNDLLIVLLEMKGDIGTLRATSEAQAKAFAQHLVEDARLANAVSDLKLAAANKAGAARVWTFVYSAVSGAIGASLSYFSRH